MNDHPALDLDPEVAAILQEVARDAGATALLETPRHLSGLAGLTEPLSSHRTGMTPGERELVERYREELSKAFVEFGIRWLVEDSSSRGTVKLAEKLPPVQEQRASLAKKLTRAHKVGTDAEPLLQRILQGDRSTEGASQCFSAALRLAPSDAKRVWLGHFFYAEGQMRSALECYQTTLRGYLDAVLRMYSLEGLACLAYSQGDLSRSMDHHHLAAKALPESPNPLVNAILVSATLGDWDSVLKYGVQLDALGEEHLETIDEHVHCLEHLKKNGKWQSPRVNSDSDWLRTVDRLGTLSRMVCNAL